MNCIEHEESKPRSTQKTVEYIYQSGGEGVTRTKSQVVRTIDQRIHRTGGTEQSRNTGREAEVGGNIDQLIYSVKEQLLANKVAVQDIADMYKKLLEREDKLKACLDQLIEIREKSKNVD